MRKSVKSSLAAALAALTALSLAGCQSGASSSVAASAAASGCIIMKTVWFRLKEKRVWNLIRNVWISSITSLHR